MLLALMVTGLTWPEINEPKPPDSGGETSDVGGRDFGGLRRIEPKDRTATSGQYETSTRKTGKADLSITRHSLETVSTRR